MPEVVHTRRPAAGQSPDPAPTRVTEVDLVGVYIP